MTGFILLDELEIFVECGFSLMEVLKTATLTPAAYLGYEDELGTMEPVKLGDLKLLDTNPLEVISNTKKIASVIANVKMLSREQQETIFSYLKVSAADE